MRRRWLVPVTVVSAPAGYGKTTLLTQVLAANAAAPLGIDCWLACDPGLATASSLAEALCRAVDAPVAPHREPDALAQTVMETMWRHSPRQVALILDDVHEIPPGSDSASLLSWIVTSLPANGHVVLAGRRAPPLALARLEVEGRVERIDESDLAFTEAELEDFAELRQVDRARVAGSGGWPALAELSASARAETTGDYVGQEVLAQLPGARRKALALLAHVGAFDPPLAAAVLDEAEIDVAKLVADLPLISRGAYGERSLHSLWRSLLASEVSSEDVASARRSAGLALMERGRVDRAMRLLIEAEAWDAVGDAIVVALGAAHRPVAHDLLEEWFKLLPETVRESPPGRLLAAVVEVEGDVGGAWRDFEECAAEFQAVGQTTGELACLVQMGQLAWWAGSMERVATVAARAWELESLGVEEAVPFACLGRALLHDIADESRKVLAELDRIPAGSLNEPWPGLVNWVRASAQLQLGHAVAAERSAEQAMAYPEELYAPMAGSPGLTRLQAIWYQGRIDEVLDELPKLQESVSQSGYRNSAVLLAAQCCVVNASRARPDQAMHFLEQARAAATLVPDAPLVDTNLTIAEAVTAIACGDEAGAADVLQSYVSRHPVGVGLPVAAQRRHLALIYVLVPSTRATWESTELGPAWTFGRDLARAVAAVRDGEPLPGDMPSLDDHYLVEAHLPPTWIAELGVAAVAEGREDGQRLLDATWPLTRDAVIALAEHAKGRMRRAARDTVAELPVPPSGHLAMRLLGPVELRVDGTPVQLAAWRRERVRSLLAYLVLHGTVSRTQVAYDLWPSLDSDAQSRNLRVTLTYLLRVLEPVRPARGASYFVRQHGGNLGLHPDGWLSADVWDFDRLCEESAEADRKGRPATALDRALQAVELWRGEPTELLSDEWAITPIERRRTRFAVVATRAGELLLAQGDSTRAGSLAERALAVDPWQEAAHRLVVASHQTAGNVLAARSALVRYRETVRELGISPDETTLMVERLLDNLPGA